MITAHEISSEEVHHLDQTGDGEQLHWVETRATCDCGGLDSGAWESDVNDPASLATIRRLRDETIDAHIAAGGVS